MIDRPSVSTARVADAISVIVPTIGRPDSLRDLLDSLAGQTLPVHEVIVADGSDTDDTARVIADPRWQHAGLRVVRVPVRPPNAVRQRVAAIQQAAGEFLLFLDDDVVLEPECTARLRRACDDDGVAGASADFNNQSWPEPTVIWRLYLTRVLGMAHGAWQGRVVGPLLRFGYHTAPERDAPLEWFATCNTLVRRSAYERAGGFSDFFLYRSTINEDVDLALKVARHGRLVFVPGARLGHFQAAGGRVSTAAAAEDDLFNRFLILHRTCGVSRARAFGQVLLFFALETAGNVAGGFRRWSWPGLGPRTLGRCRALLRLVVTQ